jgi:glutathione S-transferase
MTYVLHYAPDNASLIIRLALEHRGIPYRTQLVNRADRQQDTKAYKTLNPTGLIPVLETPQGPVFETGAILLWLADTHGGLGPAPDAAGRGDFLKWLFYLANTPHPALRQMFYPEKYITPDASTALRQGLARHLDQCFTTLNACAATRPPWLGADAPTLLDFYLCALLRWSALYPDPVTCAWFDLSNYPALHALCARTEALPCTATLQSAEGLGTHPFTAPRLPTPPEGSAT